MGWTPEEGFHTYDWRGYNEAMIVVVLALGSPTHPVDAGAWGEYTKTDRWGTFYGQEHLLFAPLFGHQYSHVWIDFRGIQDDVMRGHGIDYFENSRRATLAQHAYAIANPNGCRDYGERIWGLTACDGPMDATLTIDGKQRDVLRATPRAAPPPDEIRDDGTIAPTAADLVDRLHAGARRSPALREMKRPLRQRSLFEIRLPRRLQSDAADEPSGSSTAASIRRWAGSTSTTSASTGADRRDDRELSQRAGLEDHAEEPAHRPRPEARRLHRRLAGGGGGALSGRRLAAAHHDRDPGLSPRFLRAGARTTSVVTLQFWALGREGEVVADLVPEFERRNPGIHVDVQQIPCLAAHEKLLTAYVGDATPDVAQVGNTWIPEFAALGAIAPLDERVAALRRRSTQTDYFPGIWDTNVVGGILYGIPWYVDTRLLFYRSDLLAAAGFPAPPRTWAEWLEAMRRVKPARGAGRYAILLPVDEYEQPVILGRRARRRPAARRRPRGDFRAPAFRQAAQLLRRPLPRRPRPGVVQQPGRPTSTSSSPRATSPFYITGPWNVGEFRRRLPPEMQDKWATAPLPAPDGSASWPGVSVAGGASLVLFRASRHPEAAWKLVEFLSEPAEQVRFHGLTGDLPARRSAWGSQPGRRRPDRRLPRPARAGGAGSQGAGVGGDQRPDLAEPASPPSAAGRASTTPWPISTNGWTHPGEAARGAGGEAERPCPVRR